jgi:hypothetical protein
MLGKVRLLACKFVVGHDPNEEDCRSVAYIVYVWSFYSFGNIVLASCY